MCVSAFFSAFFQTVFFKSLFAKKTTTIPFCYKDTDLQWKKNPEESARNILSDITPEEMGKRLIFSEAIATKCFGKKTTDERNQEEAIIEGIGWIVSNRVNTTDRFGSGYDGVALKKYQFRSSLGNCDVSERKIFLCPQGSPMCLNYWSVVEQTFKSIKNQHENNPLSEVYNYYFNYHFRESKNCSKWKFPKNRPAWANNENRVKPDLNQINHDSGCIVFYKLDK